MRKVLLGIILLLLVMLGISLVTNGIEIFGLNVQSLGQIDESSENLKAKIEEVNKTIETDYPKKMTELETASTTNAKAKKEYYEYVNKSSNEQIMAAKTLRSYAIEFLWMKLGTHAREEGVNLTLEIGSGGSTGGSTLNFTVEGSYIAITNFIYAIENDSELEFRIQNFKLLPYQKEILQSTFIVSGVTLDGELSAQSSSAGQPMPTSPESQATPTSSAGQATPSANAKTTDTINTDNTTSVDSSANTTNGTNTVSQ